MTFRDYILMMPEQPDKGISEFIEFAKKDSDFPNTSDPKVLCEYLYLKLNPELTTSFQKMFLFFEQVEPNNELPKMYVGNKMLLMNDINYIIDLQNNDPKYSFL